MKTATNKIRFRNKAKGLQVIYDENGNKKEVIPQGVVMLTPEWGVRYRCLEKVDAPKKQPPTSKKKDDPKNSE